MDVCFIEVDQVMTIPRRAVQQRVQVFDEGRSSGRIGTPEQLLGFLPRQLQPMQNRPDGFAPAAAGEARLYQPDQTAERPAWLGLSANYGWTGRLSLRGTDLLIEDGGNLWAKGGRPPLR